MKADYFSELKDDGVKVGMGRRIGHSLTNYVQTSIPHKLSDLRPNANNLLPRAAQIGGGAGTAFGAAGAIVTVLAVTGAVAASAAVVAAMASPAAGIVAGGVGVIAFAASAYSNREGSHRTLANYVWNMVDNEPPKISITNCTPEQLEQAGAAALTLLNDGKNQLELLGGKMDTAYKKFDKWRNEVTGKALPFGRGPLTVNDAEELKRGILLLFDQASEPGAPAFEYVRRLCHTGNYLQAPFILSVALRNRFASRMGDSSAPKEFPDYFAGWSAVTQIRKDLRDLGNLYAAIDKEMKAAPRPMSSAPPPPPRFPPPRR